MLVATDNIRQSIAWKRQSNVVSRAYKNKGTDQKRGDGKPGLVLPSQNAGGGGGTEYTCGGDMASVLRLKKTYLW